MKSQKVSRKPELAILFINSPESSDGRCRQSRARIHRAKHAIPLSQIHRGTAVRIETQLHETIALDIYSVCEASRFVSSNPRLPEKTAAAEVKELQKIFQEFRVDRGSRILDLMCVIGRHSIHLAKKGYQVVGYDLSSLYLARARNRAYRERLSQKKTRFYQGNSRDAVRILSDANETAFNLILSMQTSIGYYDDNEDLRLLRDLHDISSPNVFS